MSDHMSGVMSTVKMRCPKCRKGQLFSNPNPYKLKTLGDMPDHCPVCNQSFRLEPGFYFGAAYVSYGLMVGWNLLMVGLIILVYGDLFNHFVELMVLGIITTVIISPIMFRYSRVLYLYMFVRYKKGTVI